MRLVYLSLLVYRAASLRLLPQSASSTSTLAALNSSNRKLSSPSTPTLSAHNTKLMSSFSTAIDTNGDTDTASNGPNPLLADWSQHEHGLPPFLSTKAHHFEPALKAAMGEHLGELGHIAANAEAPTFENTIAAFDRAGGLFSQVALLYYNLCSSNSPPELQAVELKMSGPLAAHETTVHALPGLFHRIDAVKRGMGEGVYTGEQRRLVDRIHLDFVRGGARFSPQDQVKYASITESLANLCTLFSQNLLADESQITLTLGQGDLAGLPSDLVAAAKQAAVDRGQEGFVITLSRSLVEPFITYSEDRDLRKKAWELWTKRGELDVNRDNLEVAKQILILRAQQAQMHEYASYSEYALADTMAGTPGKVMELLERVWAPAKLSIDRERAELQAYIAAETGTTEAVPIDAWDWRFYAERVRGKNYDLDETDVKKYFPLPNMITAIFDCAQQLFGLKFVPRPDLPSYHPDVMTYEVREAAAEGEGRLVALFLHDNYARPHKKSGAWMSEYRVQTKNVRNGPSVVPIIVNNNNFNKPAEGEVALLSFDDARTLFHEFGHGLHGMLSDVTYGTLAGTSVLRDFVELPSQLYEHWLSQPAVLKKHARHYQTGEAIPDSLLQRLFAAQKFGQGFATIEYTACALVDIALHQRTDLDDLVMSGFETETLQKLGMPQGVVMRHRPAHFSHLFSGSGYASAYYVYLWAEVLDADGFDAFLESGNCFDRDTALKVRNCIYSSGNSLDPAEAYRRFRGRDPEIGPMLRKKGLAE